MAAEKDTFPFRSGFWGVVGPTNSGKSTLVNALAGKKVSIVSPKVQTTYRGVRAIVDSEGSQLVLTDTPGFQAYQEPVARLLNRVAERLAKECDCLAWVFDASNPRVLRQLEKLRPRITQLKDKAHSVCLLNKVDKIAKPSLLPLMQAIYALGIFQEIIPVSARTGDGLDRVKALFESTLPQGQRLYPEGMVTDRPQSFLIAELIREKIYQATRQEIPYSAWVEVEESQAWDSPEARVPTIRAVIHVDSTSRRGILIGRKGEMLKKIGTEARRAIEELLGKKICLKLHVDVQEEWRKDSRHLNRYLELG